MLGQPGVEVLFCRYLWMLHRQLTFELESHISIYKIESLKFYLIQISILCLLKSVKKKKKVHPLRAKNDSLILWTFWQLLLHILTKFNILWIFFVLYIVVVLLNASFLLNVTSILWCPRLFHMPKNTEHRWFGLTTISMSGIYFNCYFLFFLVLFVSQFSFS